MDLMMCDRGCDICLCTVQSIILSLHKPALPPEPIAYKALWRDKTGFYKPV
jgi:hypothetical protein